jgi:hypothetical protein
MKTEIDWPLTLQLIAVIIAATSLAVVGLKALVERTEKKRNRGGEQDRRREDWERSPDIQRRRRAIYDGLVELRDRFTIPEIGLSDIQTLHGLRKESLLLFPDDSGLPTYIDEWIEHAAALKTARDYFLNPGAPHEEKWVKARSEAMSFFAEQYGGVLERKFKPYIGTP